jgi:ankyrin repeat protein
MASNSEELGLRLWNICEDNENVPTAAAVQSFIAQGANVNTKRHGDTVLIAATRKRHLDAVKALLAAEGIDINAKSSGGYTALMVACLYNHIEIAKELLAAHKLTSNFDINDKSINGSTALMYSCENSNVELTQLFLSVPGINIHLQNEYGNTALFYAKGTVNGDEIKALFQGELLPLQQITSINTLECTLFLSISHSLSLCSHSIAL